VTRTQQTGMVVVLTAVALWTLSQLACHTGL
jgi:hypothetical protein